MIVNFRGKSPSSEGPKEMSRGIRFCHHLFGLLGLAHDGRITPVIAGVIAEFGTLDFFLSLGFLLRRNCSLA